MSSTLRSQVLKEAHDLYRFRLSGASLTALVKFCASQGGEIDVQLIAAQTTLQLIANAIKGRKDITPDDVANSVQEYHRRQGDAVIQYASVKVVPLDEYPLIICDPLNSQYAEASGVKGGEFAPPTKNSPMRRVWALRQRFYFSLAAARRNKLYVSGSTTAANLAPGQVPLLPMKSLEGSAPNRYVAVMGVLGCELVPAAAEKGSTSSGARGKGATAVHGEEALDASWTLEDDAMKIQLATANATAGSCGLFCAGSIVIAKGYWDGGRLTVREFLFPPAEPRVKSLASFAHVDCFGMAPTDYDRALRMEQRTKNAVVLVLAHLHLDKEETFAMLREFFSRLAQVPAGDLTLVMVGDFISQPMVLSDPSHHDESVTPYAKYKALFDELGATIAAAAPSIAQGSQFVFVPGPLDLTPCGQTLPQYPLSSGLFTGLLKKCPKSILAPNPCRLRFGTHEIVVARVDSQRLWRKPRVVRPLQNAEDGTEYHKFDHLVRNVVEQGTIAPALGVATADDQEILWARDHALRLFPLPQTVVMCESTEQWETKCGDALFINPGTFSLEATFLWLTPSDHSAVVNRL